ncbi:MAG TPA: hypothetical protein VGD56_19015 [Gemmatirosa sp.]
MSTVQQISAMFSIGGRATFASIGSRILSGVSSSAIGSFGADAIIAVGGSEVVVGAVAGVAIAGAGIEAGITAGCIASVAGGD